MTERPADWYPDPTGAAAQRYWDGTAWTDHLHGDPPDTGSTSVTNPSGFAAPTVAAAALAPSASPTLWTFLDSLGPRARQRPQPLLRTALAGVGGLIGSYGVLGLVASASESRAAGIVAGILLTAAALVVRLKLRNEELHAAAVAAGLTGIIVTIAVALNPSTTSDFGPAFLLVALALALGWALPGFKGSSVFLGIAAIALVLGAGSIVSGDSPSVDDCQTIFEETGDVPASCYDGTSSNDVVGNDPTGVLRDTSIVYFVFAGLYMGLVALLDRRGYHGVATSLVTAGLLSALTGLIVATVKLLFTSDGGDATGAAALAIITGLAVCLVGSAGRAERRATTWWGAAILGIGSVGFLFSAVKPESNTAIAWLLLVVAAILIASPRAARAIRAANTSSSDSSELPPPS